jgi:hypothetical protein
VVPVAELVSCQLLLNSLIGGACFLLFSAALLHGLNITVALTALALPDTPFFKLYWVCASLVSAVAAFLVPACLRLPPGCCSSLAGLFESSCNANAHLCCAWSNVIESGLPHALLLLVASLCAQVSLNTSYVMEFFLQSLVKKRYLAQDKMLQARLLRVCLLLSDFERCCIQCERVCVLSLVLSKLCCVAGYVIVGASFIAHLSIV